MVAFLLTGLVLYSSFACCAFFVKPSAHLFSRIFWRFEPQAAISNSTPALYFIFSSLASASLFGFFWMKHQSLALPVTLAAILLLAIFGAGRIVFLTSIQFKHFQDQVMQSQFQLRDGVVVSERQQPMKADVCALSVNSHRPPGYYGRPYESYRIALFSIDQGLVAGNSYFAKEQTRGMLKRLKNEADCPTFSLVFSGYGQIERHDPVVLGGRWLPTLCGGMHRVPPAMRSWWQGWLSADMLDQLQIAQVDELSLYLTALQLEVADDAALSSDCSRLEQLLAAVENVQVLRTQTFQNRERS